MASKCNSTKTTTHLPLLAQKCLSTTSLQAYNSVTTDGDFVHTACCGFIIHYGANFVLLPTTLVGWYLIKWPPQLMYYVQNGSNSAVDGLHVKISS